MTTKSVPTWASKPYDLLVQAYKAATFANDVVVDHYYAGTPVVVLSWRDLQDHLETLPDAIRGVDTLETLVGMYDLCERARSHKFGAPQPMTSVVSSWDALPLFLAVRDIVDRYRKKGAAKVVSGFRPRPPHPVHGPYL